MCQNIYVSSNKELPEIKWNESSPGFYIEKVTNPDLIKSLKEIMKSEFFYEAFSHMGCSCGLCYADWLSEDNPIQRRSDVRDFAEYVDHHKKNNLVKIFSTDWSKFPDEYSKKEFKTSEIGEEEFYVEELVLLTVV